MNNHPQITKENAIDKRDIDQYNQLVLQVRLKNWPPSLYEEPIKLSSFVRDYHRFILTIEGESDSGAKISEEANSLESITKHLTIMIDRGRQMISQKSGEDLLKSLHGSNGGISQEDLELFQQIRTIQLCFFLNPICRELIARRDSIIEKHAKLLGNINPSSVNQYESRVTNSWKFKEDTQQNYSGHTFEIKYSQDAFARCYSDDSNSWKINSIDIFYKNDLRYRFVDTKYSIYVPVVHSECSSPNVTQTLVLEIRHSAKIYIFYLVDIAGLSDLSQKEDEFITPRTIDDSPTLIDYLCRLNPATVCLHKSEQKYWITSVANMRKEGETYSTNIIEALWVEFKGQLYDVGVKIDQTPMSGKFILQNMARTSRGLVWTGVELVQGEWSILCRVLFAKADVDMNAETVNMELEGSNHHQENCPEIWVGSPRNSRRLRVAKDGVFVLAAIRYPEDKDYSVNFCFIHKGNIVSIHCRRFQLQPKIYPKKMQLRYDSTKEKFLVNLTGTIADEFESKNVFGELVIGTFSELTAVNNDTVETNFFDTEPYELLAEELDLLVCEFFLIGLEIIKKRIKYSNEVMKMDPTNPELEHKFESMNENNQGQSPGYLISQISERLHKLGLNTK